MRNRFSLFVGLLCLGTLLELISVRAHAVALIEPDSLLRLSEYDRNYLVMGSPNHKIQMSVKEQPFDDVPLFLTYTQMMFWQNIKYMGPFSEVNFNPSLFYRWTFDSSDVFTAIDFGGFEHKSNGEGRPTRRSYNDSFIELHADHTLGRGALLSTSKFYALYGLDSENHDLPEYFGFWQTSLSYLLRDIGYVKLFEIYLTLHPGGRSGVDFRRGFQELGLRVKVGESRSIPYLYIQYFNGFCEGLATYDRSTSSIRFGIQL